MAIDSEMPQKRIELIFEKLSPRAVIYDYKNAERVNLLPESFHKYLFDDIRESVSDDNLLGEIRKKQIDTDPIYVVFTSGSTGVPKGVAACHRSVIDYTETLCEAVGFDRETVFGNQTPLYFDAPLKEIMPTIKFGATTYFIPKQLFMFPIKLCDYLNKYRINTVCWVVSALTMISSLGALEKNPDVAGRVRLVCNESGVLGVKAVMMSSGTMSLACSLEGIPGAIVYKANPITYIVGRSLVKIKYLSIANILLDKPAWREFIQFDASARKLAKYMQRCACDPSERGRFLSYAEKLRSLLHSPKDMGAADWLIKRLEG